jgi:hypothetical protein
MIEIVAFTVRAAEREAQARDANCVSGACGARAVVRRRRAAEPMHDHDGRVRARHIAKHAAQSHVADVWIVQVARPGRGEWGGRGARAMP